MRRPPKKSRRLSKKLRRYPPPKPRRSPRRARRRREAAEGDGLRRDALRADQRAQEALVPQGVSPALRGEALVQVDLPVRGGGAHHGGELLRVPAGDGGRMPGRYYSRNSPRATPSTTSANRARRRPQPPLRADRVPREREPGD